MKQMSFHVVARDRFRQHTIALQRKTRADYGFVLSRHTSQY